jgi:hypothetical protein
MQGRYGADTGRSSPAFENFYRIVKNIGIVSFYFKRGNRNYMLAFYTPGAYGFFDLFL